MATNAMQLDKESKLLELQRSGMNPMQGGQMLRLDGQGRKTITIDPKVWKGFGDQFRNSASDPQMKSLILKLKKLQGTTSSDAKKLWIDSNGWTPFKEQAEARTETSRPFRKVDPNWTFPPLASNPDNKPLVLEGEKVIVHQLPGGQVEVEVYKKGGKVERHVFGTHRVGNKVPVLGDIPLMGRLFRSDSARLATSRTVPTFLWAMPKGKALIAATPQASLAPKAASIGGSNVQPAATLPAPTPSPDTAPPAEKPTPVTLPSA